MCKIIGICKSFNAKFGIFRIEVTKEEYDRVKTKYCHDDDTNYPVRMYMDKHYVTVKVPKEQYFTDDLFNRMYSGLNSTVTIKDSRYNFIPKGSSEAMIGTSFSLVAIQPIV
jgi:hypothetical protein